MTCLGQNYTVKILAKAHGPLTGQSTKVAQQMGSNTNTKLQKEYNMKFLQSWGWAVTQAWDLTQSVKIQHVPCFGQSRVQ